MATTSDANGEDAAGGVGFVMDRVGGPPPPDHSAPYLVDRTGAPPPPDATPPPKAALGELRARLAAQRAQYVAMLEKARGIAHGGAQQGMLTLLQAKLAEVEKAIGELPPGGPPPAPARGAGGCYRTGACTLL